MVRPLMSHLNEEPFQVGNWDYDFYTINQVKRGQELLTRHPQLKRIKSGDSYKYRRLTDAA